MIRRGLADPNVRFGRRLALVQRAKRILASPGLQKKLKGKVEDFGDLQLIEPNVPQSVCWYIYSESVCLSVYLSLFSSVYQLMRQAMFLHAS